MNLKQFKLTNDDEIICEVVEYRDQDPDDEGAILIRKVLKINTAEDFENNIRYYSFRPWVSFQDDPAELSVLNVGHIIGETLPSNTLAVHYAAAVREVELAKKNKKEFNLDEIVNQMADMDEDALEAFLEHKLREDAIQRNEDARFIADSAQPNIIHFKPPKDTVH